MYCSECGKEIENDSMFCPECGAKQELDQEIQGEQSNKKMQTETNTVFCIKCGCKIPSDSRFCPECRAPQNNSEPVKIRPQMKQVRATAPTQNLSQEDEAKLKKRNKIIGIVVGAAVALCVIIIALSSIIKPSINLNKYISISFEGYDTVGKAVVTFDSEKFEADYEKKLSNATSKGKSSGLSKYSSEEAYLEALFDSYDTSTASGKFLSTCVNGSLDVSTNLSNGDVVTYTWNCDDDTALSVYGYKLKYEDIEMTVEGLEEAETFDPFDGIEIVFEGIGPNGSASVSGEPTANAAQELNYEIDKNSGLSNGDTVTVTVTMYYDDPVEYCIENYGMIPSPVSKTYTVEGLNSYITSSSEISEECLKDMQEQAEDVYNSNVAQNWGDEETLKSFEYIGNYLLINKDSDDYWGNSNILYLVYKAKVKDEYSNDGETYKETNDIYWYICYYDLLVDTNGDNTVDLTSYRTPSDRFTIDSGISSGWWSTKSWYYYGYQTLDELYKVVVTSNTESYKHEDNVDEEITSNTDEEETEELSGEDGIIFPNSSEKEISESEIKELSDEELRYAINELYARHGYIFKDEGLLAYYEKYDWYEKSVKPDDFSMDLFNEVEKTNVEALQKERDSRN